MRFNQPYRTKFIFIFNYSKQRATHSQNSQPS